MQLVVSLFSTKFLEILKFVGFSIVCSLKILHRWNKAILEGCTKNAKFLTEIAVSIKKLCLLRIGFSILKSVYFLKLIVKTREQGHLNERENIMFSLQWSLQSPHLFVLKHRWKKKRTKSIVRSSEMSLREWWDVCHVRIIFFYFVSHFCIRFYLTPPLNTFKWVTITSGLLWTVAHEEFLVSERKYWQTHSLQMLGAY